MLIAPGLLGTGGQLAAADLPGGQVGVVVCIEQHVARSNIAVDHALPVRRPKR